MTRLAELIDAVKKADVATASRILEAGPSLVNERIGVIGQGGNQRPLA